MLLTAALGVEIHAVELWALSVPQKPSAMGLMRWVCNVLLGKRVDMDLRVPRDRGGRGVRAARM